MQLYTLFLIYTFVLIDVGCCSFRATYTHPGFRDPDIDWSPTRLSRMWLLKAESEPRMTVESYTRGQEIP